MKNVTIHSSGSGADKLEIVSWGNGSAYNFKFGEAGFPMRNIFLQDDDALRVRQEYDDLCCVDPEAESREVWMTVLDPYL